MLRNYIDVLRLGVRGIIQHPKTTMKKLMESFLRLVMKIVKAGMAAKQTAAPFQAKIVVPPAGIEPPEHVFDGVQPQVVVLQRTLGTPAESNEPMVAVLERQCEFHVSTGNKFLEQWRPQ